jgi:hypothetical protein
MVNEGVGILSWIACLIFKGMLDPIFTQILLNLAS